MGAANSAPHGVGKMLSGAELASCPARSISLLFQAHRRTRSRRLCKTLKTGHGFTERVNPCLMICGGLGRQRNTLPKKKNSSAAQEDRRTVRRGGIDGGACS